MPAIITSSLRKQIARDFFDGFTAGTSLYYISIGRSQLWDSSDTTPTPVDTPSTIQDVRDNMQSVKKVQGSSLVVPRYNWTSGTVYNQYDDTVQGIPNPPYYVKTDNNQVYICYETGRDSDGAVQPSIIEPTYSNLHPFRLADGYVWKFLYTISAERSNNFMAANFMPVQKIGLIDSNSTGIETRQKQVQDASQAGEIVNITLTDAGAGYTTHPNVTITSSSGGGASATAHIDSALGVVTHITMDPDSSRLKLGSAYFAPPTITLTGGGPTTAATARAVLGPDSGFGNDAREDLAAQALMFNSKLEGDDSDLFTGQDFRQVSLVKDPRQRNGVVFTDLTGNAMDKLTLGTTTTAFTRDKILEGATSLANANVVHIDSNEIYYTQTNQTGFTPFQDGEALGETTGAGAGIIDSARIRPKYDKETGEILFIDNRAAVLRDPVQAEDVKIIIQF